MDIRTLKPFHFTLAEAAVLTEALWFYQEKLDSLKSENGIRNAKLCRILREEIQQAKTLVK
jgi:hypothetical protein